MEECLSLVAPFPFRLMRGTIAFGVNLGKKVVHWTVIFFFMRIREAILREMGRYGITSIVYFLCRFFDCIRYVNESMTY